MARPKAKTGRKLIPIDPKIVEGMASVGATDNEIGDFVGASDETIRRRFGAILTKSRAGMKLRLRQAQYKLALAGNPALCIWLGKQMLGQADESRIKVGNLEQLSDDELKALAAGKIPKP